MRKCLDLDGSARTKCVPASVQIYTLRTHIYASAEASVVLSG